MDPKDSEEVQGVSDVESASPEPVDSGDSEDAREGSDYEEEEDDETVERFSARAQPPSRSRSPIEIEVLSSDDEDVPSQAPSSQTVPVSSSPIVSQRSEDYRQSEEEEEMAEDEDVEEEEDMDQEVYDSEEIEDSPVGEEHSDDEDHPLQISEQDVEDPVADSEADRVEPEASEEDKVCYEFSRPFEPTEPLDLPVMDPLTQDLMDSVEELKALPDHVLSKLTNLWASKNSELRIIQEKLNAASSEGLDNVDIDVEATLNVEQTVEALNEALAKKQRELKILQVQRDGARSREEESMRQLRRKDEEVQRIVTENTSLSGQLSQAIASKCETLVKLQNVERKEIQLQNKEWRLDSENASLRNNCSHLSENLDATMKELTQLKHESTLRITDLEISLRDSKTECERYESQLGSFKESIAQHEHRIENLQELLRESRDSAIALQEAHTQEVQAKSHMARLYQEQTAEAEKVANSYLEAIQELQNTIRSTAEKYGDLETRYEMDKINLEREIEQKNKLITNLREELTNANELLERYSEMEMEEQVSALAPSASTARKIIQSNMSFTEIYHKYKEKEEQLEFVNAEREQLRSTMQSVVKELEDRAPIFAKEREALNVSVIENERLISDFDKMAQELQTVKDEAHQVKRNAGVLKRDKDRMQIQIDDLCRQNTILLREIEALKTRRSSFRPSFGQSLDSYGSMSPNDMITERLLPFHDIEDLQRRNAELLAALRELTNQAEDADLAKASGVDIAKLSEQLDNALLDLKNLQEKEKQHELLINQLTEQRNHFRQMSQQGRSSQDIGLSPMKMDTSPMRRLVPNPTAEEKELKQKLLQTQEAFERANKQIDNMIKENKDIVDGLRKQVDEQKKDVDEKCIMVSKLKALVENREGKLASATSKVQELSKQLEITESKAKSQAENLACEIKKRQELISELHNTRINMNRYEVALNKVKTELGSSRAMEESLKNECATWKQSFEERGSIQASVEQMRMTLERSRTEGKDMLIRQLDETRTEAAGLRKRLQEETARLGGELVQLQAALDAERANVVSKQLEISAAQNETVLVEARLAQAQRDVQALRAHRNPSVDSSIQTEVFVSEEVVREKRMAQRASEFEVLITSLRSELEMAKSRSAEYKNIADATERSLLEAKECGRILEEKLKESTDQWEATIGTMRSTINSLENELAAANARVQTASAEATQKLEIVQKHLAESKNENKNLRLIAEESEVTKSALNAAEEEVHRLGERLANETEQNMKNMQIYADLKSEIAAAVAEKAKLNEELEQTKRNILQLETELEEKNQQLDDITVANEEELTKIKDHNSALYDQLQTMGAELSALKYGNNSERENMFGEGTSQLNISNISTDDSQSSEQLIQVIKFLRREKDAACLQVEELKSKLADTKAKKEFAEQQLEEQSRQSNLGAPEGPELVTRARYEALTRRLETMNALSESANLQREECAALRKQNNELQEKVKSLLEKVSAAQAEARRFEEKAGALQVEFALVKGEATRWRNCANQLTEKANQANPEELKRLLQERENLQKQLQAERDMLNKEREEAKKLRETAADMEQRLLSTSGDLSQHKIDLAKLTEEHAKLSAANKELNDKHKDLASKELTVRRIAKKYKTQHENLVEANKKEAAAAASKGEAVNSQLVEIQAKLAEVEARDNEKSSTVKELEEKLNTINEQISLKNAELEKIKNEFMALKEKEEKMRSTLSLAKGSLAEKQRQLDDAKSKITLHTEEVNKYNQEKEELKVRSAALQSQFEARAARYEKEIQELRPLAEAHKMCIQPQNVQTEQQKQAEEVSQQALDNQPSGDGKQPMRTANVQPFPARGRGKGQAVAVTPTSRVGTPMALLRPMTASTGQVQTPLSSNTVAPASTSEPSIISRPHTSTVRATVRVEQPPAEPSIGQDIQEEAPSSSANVQLVRPHEVHLAGPPSQSQASAAIPIAQPSSSQPTLKRSREPEVSAEQQEEPKSKQPKSELAAASTEVEMEPSPDIRDPEEIALEDSEEDVEQSQENIDEDEGDIIDEEENDDPDENLGEEASDDNEEEEEVQEFVEEVEEPVDQNADDALLAGEDQDLEPSEDQQDIAVDDNDDENEVLILDDDSSSSAQNAGIDPEQQNRQEPAFSSDHEPTRPSTFRSMPLNPSMLSLPHHQNFEEVGDFGIVPSTPTLFARQNVFSEAISSAPQVPQVTQGRISTLQETVPTQVSSSGQPERLETADDSSTGRSVPSTPLLASPQDNLIPTTTTEHDDSVIEIIEEGPDPSDFGELPSSSSTVPSIRITQPSESMEHEQPAHMSADNLSLPHSMRGNRARRSGGNFGPGRARSTRPTPITWNHPEEQQQQQPQNFRGRGRSMRRTRPPPGGPFHPLDFM